MELSWMPWNDYAGLTQERVLIVANIIRIARDLAADDHHPERGETNWTLGVSCYERTCKALVEAAAEYPWLNIEAGGGGGPVPFVFSAGGHPIRFCHGDPDDVPSRYQQPILPELLKHHQLFALDGNLPLDRFLRITISNDADGRPEHIYLAEMEPDSKEPTNIYLIPEMAAPISIFAPPIPPANIPPVMAEVETIDAAALADDANKQKTGSDGN